MEVSSENSDSPDSPVGQQKPQGRTEKMISKKRRCVRAMVNEMYQKQHMVPLNEDKPQDIAGTSRKTEDIKTKVEHKTAETAPSPKEQRKPPAMMVKVESKKRRHSMYYRIPLMRHILEMYSIITGYPYV